ncbi:unnamed protein product [Brachionus calyciflorus]|uniref:Uncharacterized protein n=1 Tax=Brachionus calyciflorus TaxID=104777 RepID=A0A814H075_9BILA|nr:unnamed protein product [Brachionus calyciflorus]
MISNDPNFETEKCPNKAYKITDSHTDEIAENVLEISPNTITETVFQTEINSFEFSEKNSNTEIQNSEAKIQSDRIEMPLSKNYPNDSIILDLPKSYSSHKRCIVCFKSNLYIKLHVVPSEARVQIMVLKGIFIPDNCRICFIHLQGFRFNKEALDSIVSFKNEIKMESKSVKDLICSLIDASKKKSLFDEFADFNSLDDETCKETTGFFKKEFEIINHYLADMKDSNVRTKSQALAIYLFWLKTGLNQEAIKAHFKIENRTDVSRYCEQVRAALSEFFVPNYLGCNSLRRDQWVTQNSIIATELYSLSNDQFVVIADGTYIYCQKSSNNFFQRKSYSCPKKGH